MRSPVKRRRAPARRVAAFTLVELLVVIGIIAVLIGILLPTLGAANRQARITQCMAIQREIASAVANHAIARQGYYPIAGLIVDTTGVGVTGVTPRDLNDATRRRYTYTYVREGGMRGLTLAPWHAAVATFMGKKKALDGETNAVIIEDEIGSRSYLKYFMCPSHKDSERDVRESLVYQGGSLAWTLQQSYVINEAVFGMNDRLGRLRGKASRVRKPSTTMMLADGLQSGTRTGSATWVGSGVQWITFWNKTEVPPITLEDAFVGNTKAADPKSFDRLRHRGKMNVVFFDGHAETRQIKPSDLRSIHLLAK